MTATCSPPPTSGGAAKGQGRCTTLKRMSGRSCVAPAEGRCSLVSVDVHDSGRVARVRAGLPGAQRTAQLAATFTLLGDPNRLRLLTALREGEMCVSDLAAVSGQSESAVSHALRLLRTRRIVTVRRRGRHAFYRLADQHVRLLLELALAHHGHATPLDVLETAE